MPIQSRKRGGGAKKIGRNKAKCERYRREKRREKNRVAKFLKLPQTIQIKRRIRELREFVNAE